MIEIKAVDNGNGSTNVKSRIEGNGMQILNEGVAVFDAIYEALEDNNLGSIFALGVLDHIRKSTHKEDRRHE